MENETPYQRTARLQRDRQLTREQRMNDKISKRAMKRKAVKVYDTLRDANADKIDGYDRDDIGLSPDF